MIALAVIAFVIVCCYVWVIAVAITAGRADRALQRMWESDEPLRRIGGKKW